MKNLKNQRGILLLCTLVIMVILSVLLMVGVYRMESSVMVTKRTIWEIKSYWAARAGNTIAADGCIRNVQWPNSNFLDKAGDYLIKFNDTASNKFISGSDASSDSHFNIYYINHLLSKYNDKHSNYVSETAFSNNFNNMYSNVNALPYGEIYCLTAGKSGASIVGLELVYQLSYNPNLLGGTTKPNQTTMQAGESHTASAAMYVGKNIDATVNSTFTVQASDSTRACIVSGGDVSIQGDGGKPDQDGGGPLNIYEGAIFANSANINGQPISPSNTNSNLINYGLNVFSPSDVSFQFPDDQLDVNAGKSIPQGTFCFIEMPRDYQEVEYRAIISTMKSMYLTPEDFKTIYIEPITLLGREKFVELYDNLKDNPINLVDCSDGKYDCNSIFDSYFSSADEYFTQQGEEESGFLNWLVTRFNGEMEADNAHEMTKLLYENYLKSKINDAIREYRYQPSAENTSSPFEAFFVPDGVANVSKENSRFNISYAGMTRARLLGNLARYAGVAGYTDDEVNQDDENTNYDTKRYLNLLKNTLGLDDRKVQEIINSSKGKYSEHFQQEKSGYVTKRQQVDGGYIQILKNLDGSNDASLNFVAKDNISFNTTELQMTTNCNLTSEGYFNFATYERTGSEREGMYWYAHDQVGDYKTAEKARAGIKLTGNGAITANNINIKGFVYTDTTNGANNPYLQSTDNGDIIFEAPGSSVLQTGEGKVSIISSRNIDIKRASVESGTNADGDVKFKGVLYSDGNLYVNAGSGVNFNLTGTIICKGTMTMSNLNSVEVTYNPSISRIVLSRFIPSWSEDETILTDALETGQYTINTGTFKFVNRI